jgi:pantoate--beta-alanine ligase
MELIKTSKVLVERLMAHRKNHDTIGFVPTMGALHMGHLSLVKRARDECDLVLVSIFVNPNQFNDTADLDNYPRDLEKDVEMLKSSPCELLFVPGVKEIYPQPDTRFFDFGNLDKVMEGAHRPGHFNGVAQVVSRLFDISKPDKAYFGQKDFQQLAIVREMVRQLNFGTDVVACPIVREPDKLAMSSRNLLLSKKQRKSAPLIAETLFESCNFGKSNSVSDTRLFVLEKINASPELEVEYFEIVDGASLQSLDNWRESDYIVGCIAVFAGNVRLIDNVVYKFRSNEY